MVRPDWPAPERSANRARYWSCVPRFAIPRIYRFFIPSILKNRDAFEKFIATFARLRFTTRYFSTDSYVGNFHSTVDRIYRPTCDLFQTFGGPSFPHSSSLPHDILTASLKLSRYVTRVTRNAATFTAEIGAVTDQFTAFP